MSLKNKIILGVDTSCYTTSIAAINLGGDVLLNKKVQLKVKAGNKGLRQSEGLFQHVSNFGELFGDFRSITGDAQIVAVCASKIPRPQEGSYMPVFNAGYNFAKAVAQIVGAKFYETSHQEGHIKAAQFCSNLNSNRFLAVHISGGTTEILLSSKKGAGFEISLVGGTKDISAGQLLDRIGVRLGYSFPAGRVLDQNAYCHGEEKCIFKISSKDGYMNLSGVETQAYRIIDAQNLDERNKMHMSYHVLKAISEKLKKSIICLSGKYGCTDVLFAGGVASSKFLSTQISRDLRKKDINTYWSSPEYSADNAAGVALIGRDIYLEDGDEKNEA